MHTSHSASEMPSRSASGVEAGATEDSQRHYRPRAKRAHADGPNENACMAARKRARRTRRTPACNNSNSCGGTSETAAFGIESSPLHPLPPLPVELCDCIAGYCDDAALCTLRAASRTHRAWVDRQARWLELAAAAAHAPFARRRRRLTAPQAQEAVAALWGMLRQPGEGAAAATPFVLRLCVAALRRPLPLRFAQVDRENEVGARGGPSSGRAAGACVPLPPEWRPEWRTEWRRRRSRPTQADAAARQDERPRAPAAQPQARGGGDEARWPHRPQCHYQWLVRLAHGPALAFLEAGDTHVTPCVRADWPPHVAFLSAGTYAAWDRRASRGARRCCSECPSLLVRVQPTADGAEERGGSGPSDAVRAVAMADVREVLVGEDGRRRLPSPERCCVPAVAAARAEPGARAPAPPCARAEGGPAVEHCAFSLIIARRHAPPAGALHTVVTSLAQSVAGYALPEPLPPPVARRLAWALCGVAAAEAEAEAGGPATAGLAALRALLVIASGARQVRALHIFFVHGRAGPLLAAGELAFALRSSTPSAARHVERAMLLEEAVCDGHGGLPPAAPVRIPVVCVRPFAVLSPHAATPASVPLVLVRLLEVVADAVAAVQRVLPGYSLHDYDPSGETARCMQAAWLFCSAPPSGARGSADAMPPARRRLLSLLAVLRALDARVPSPAVDAASSRPWPWPRPRPGLLLQPRHQQPPPPPLPSSSRTPCGNSADTRTDHPIGDSTASARSAAARYARDPSCSPPHFGNGLAPPLPPRCDVPPSSVPPPVPLPLGVACAHRTRIGRGVLGTSTRSLSHT